MNSNKRDIASADDKCHICNSEKREDGMCLCAESWRNPLPTPAPVAELPKEATLKAKELVDKFEPMCLKYKGAAQKCALICVDEIIKALTHQNPNFEDNTYWSPIDYWQQVRTAINQL